MRSSAVGTCLANENSHKYAKSNLQIIRVWRFASVSWEVSAGRGSCGVPRAPPPQEVRGLSHIAVPKRIDCYHSSENYKSVVYFVRNVYGAQANRISASRDSMFASYWFGMAHGIVVVKALRYKPGGLGSETR
jgi:hypothetical protein